MLFLPPTCVKHCASIGVSVVALAACAGQKADAAFEPKIESPTYRSSSGPVACIDQAHNNSHTESGLYEPFAKLLRADGYRVEPVETHFDNGVPPKCATVVIVNAAGGRTYKLFGLNLPTKSRERRQQPAFARNEIDTLHKWVERGGGLLLIADHYPYGSAASELSEAFGVEMSAGFSEAANRDPRSKDPGQLIFSSENGLLAAHPITNGRVARERVNRVVTFTGQSLLARNGTPLLVLGDSAVDFVPPSPLRARTAAGRSQGVAIDVGRGRVVVLGEAAVLTAQIDDKGRRFGMQLPDNDNAQFALNIMHWLTRAL